MSEEAQEREGGDGGKRRRRKVPKWLPYVLHAAVLGGIAVAATKYINGGEFARAVAKFDWRWAPVICLLSLGYVLVKAARFVRMMREICPDVPASALWRVYVAGQAATLVPGGGAARAAMLKEVGVPAAQTAAPLLIAAWSDQAVFIACSLVAALWVEEVRRPVAILLAVLGVVSVVLGVEAVRTWLGRLVERILGRFDLLDHWREFVASLKEVAKPRTLALGFGNALVADGLLIAALYLAVRGVGAPHVPVFNLILAFALPTMLGRLSALPGGVGVTEAGMIPLIDQAPGVSLDQAAAAVAVYRFGSVLFAAMVGGLVYFFGWRASRTRKQAAAVAATTKEATA
jgi:uncharacterized protein (TIRG00374 family)